VAGEKPANSNGKNPTGQNNLGDYYIVSVYIKYIVTRLHSHIHVMSFKSLNLNLFWHRQQTL
jgi:hypothetical protein